MKAFLHRVVKIPRSIFRRFSPITRLNEGVIVLGITPSALSESLDIDSYVSNNPDLSNLSTTDLKTHYLKMGRYEPRNFSHISKEAQLKVEYRKALDLDPEWYRDLYQDLRHLSIEQAANHYETNGRAEGRIGSPQSIELHIPEGALDDSKGTIVLVSHEASRTGAPILIWNLAKELREEHNVVVILPKGGELLDNFDEVADLVIDLSSSVYVQTAALQRVVDLVALRIKPDYSIVNSAESGKFVPLFEQAGIPVIYLIHEFGNYISRKSEHQDALNMASEVVFPARAVMNSNFAHFENFRISNALTLAQGKSEVPVNIKTTFDLENRHSNGQADVPQTRPNVLRIIGLGTVIHRKGADLFIQVAHRYRQLFPDSPAEFVWIGDAIDPIYSDFLRDYLRETKLDDTVSFHNAVDDLAPLLSSADALLLTSRHDPFPNVAIDALWEGLPVLAFDGAGGVAEWLADQPEHSSLAIPYLDVEKMAHVLHEVVFSDETALLLRESLWDRARSSFQMHHYSAELHRIGLQLSAQRAASEISVKQIFDAKIFDTELLVGHNRAEISDIHAVRRFVQLWKNCGPNFRVVRRPVAGFNPYRFASEHKIQCDPLSEYVSQGLPDGPWKTNIVDYKATKQSRLKTLVHAHLHYPDLLEELLNALRPNKFNFDLLVTTTDSYKAAEINRLAEIQSVNIRVLVVENLGRDVYPFMNIGSELSDYDLVLHVHGKKTKSVPGDAGLIWRKFIWENLLGDGSTRMADSIVTAFENDSDLGLVFPSDPNLIGWGENRSIAVELLGRMHIGESLLSEYFDFPVGTMFWARPKALNPMFDMKLSPEDIPNEPIAYDGTILHALERLIPSIVMSQGYTTAETRVPGSVR
jgi:glycosyltransferase involved in cell wall biosynthesis